MRIFTSNQYSHVWGPLRECHLIRSGASGLPYYCTQLVSISVVIELLAVCGGTTNQKPKTRPKDNSPWRESTWDAGVFIIIIIIFTFWCLSYNKHSISPWHRPCVNRRGQRGDSSWGSEHGFTSSQWWWHPAHSCFPSPSFSPFRCSRFDDCILPTPHFCTRLPSPSSLRRSGSFPTRLGPPQQA